MDNSYINKLPDELLFIIFENLKISELFLNCKLVNKRFNYLINQIKFKELIIGNTIFSNNYWHFSFRPINLEKSIICKRLDFFDYSSFKNNNFKNLTKLKLNLIEYDFDYMKLNQFENLETLEIDNSIYLNNDDKILSLPCLKYLKFFISNSKIKINSNCLEYIYCNNLKYLDLVNPKSIRIIELEKNQNDNLEEFINLEILKYREVSYQYKNILPNLISLKTIHFYSSYKFVLDFHKEFINSILEQQSIQKMYWLKIYFNGIKIENNKFDYGFEFKDDLYLFKKNYNNLEDKLIFFTKINYHNLMNIFDHQLPNTFFQHFINIQECKTDKIFDKKHFFFFLNNCPLLSFLYLENVNLDQNFYENLPIICPLLKVFSLYEKEFINLNFEFIFKFKLLRTLKTNYSLTTEFVIKYLKDKSKIISYLSFLFNEEIWIRKFNRNQFDLQNSKYRWSCLDLNELKKLCLDLELNDGRTRLYSAKKKKSIRL